MRVKVIALLLVVISSFPVFLQAGDKTLERARQRYEKEQQKIADEFEKAIEKHEQDSEASKAKLLKAYAEAIKRVTKKGDLDAANKLLAEKKRLLLGEADGEEAGGDGEGVADESPVRKPKPSGGKKKMDVYANCDDSFTMYQNKTLLLTGANVNVSMKPVTIRVGDVIMVRTINIGGPKGFACVFKGKKKYIQTSTTHWKSYIPKNKQKWFLKKGITNVKAAVIGNNQNWKNNILTKTNLDCEAIWGTTGSVSYLVLVVTKDCFRKIK